MHIFKIPDQNTLRSSYEQYLPVRTLLAKDIEAAIEEVLLTLSTHLTIKGRVKEFGSYYKKYIKNLNSKQKEQPLTDIIGIRVVCPFFEDLYLTEDLLRKNFQVVETDFKGANYSFKEFGYESTHLLIKIPEELIEKRKGCDMEFVEIQIRTILQDAWAEAEHELFYKAEFTPLDEPMKRKLAAVNASLFLADTIFQEIRGYQRQQNGEARKRRDSFLKKIEESTNELLGALPNNNFNTEADEDEEAIDEELQAFASHSIDELLLKALSAHNKRQYKKSIRFYTYILEKDTDNVVGSIIYGHRGMAKFAMSLYEEAILDFSKALELDHKSYKSAYYRGVVKSVLQRHPEAVDDFTLSLNINPYYAVSLYRRSQAYYHLEDIPQALADCEAALALEPDLKEFNTFKDLLLSKLNV